MGSDLLQGCDTSLPFGVAPDRHPPYRSVTARIVVDDVEELVGFLRDVFDAEGEVVAGRPVDVYIGDSIVMVSPATERDAFAAFLYVYVRDADVTYARALAA